MSQKNKNIESLYNLYVDDLFTYALYLGFEKETVMDAIHDVFCKLAAEKELFHEVENVKFYLFRSLKNRLYDIYKTRRAHMVFWTIDMPDPPFDIHVTVEDLLIDKEEQQQIRLCISEMLGSLTQRQREIVYLRYVQEYDYLKIAELLNISLHSCRKLLSKAMQNLREKYGTLILLFLF